MEGREERKEEEVEEEEEEMDVDARLIDPCTERRMPGVSETEEEMIEE